MCETGDSKLPAGVVGSELVRSCGSGAGARAVEGCETGRCGAPDQGPSWGLPRDEGVGSFLCDGLSRSVRKPRDKMYFERHLGHSSEDEFRN